MIISGNTILITGGSSGIGFELAKQLLPLQNKIIITGRDSEKLEKAKKALPGIITIQSDVSDPESIRTLSREIQKNYDSVAAATRNIRSTRSWQNVSTEHQSLFQKLLAAH